MSVRLHSQGTHKFLILSSVFFWLYLFGSMRVYIETGDKSKGKLVAVFG